MKSKDLWRIFYCLFRGCVGLAYPDNWDQNLDPETAAQPIPTQEEAIPLGPDGLPRDSTTGVLDLDMNDRNIMIGDYDFDDRAGGHEHAEIPVFKIGDLGIARAFRTPYWQRHAEARLYNMACGNPACSTPESFSEGWKNVGDWDSYDREETAGKFSWKTNLWQAAQLMNIVVSAVKRSRERWIVTKQRNRSRNHFQTFHQTATQRPSPNPTANKSKYGPAAATSSMTRPLPILTKASANL